MRVSFTTIRSLTLVVGLVAVPLTGCAGQQQSDEGDMSNDNAKGDDDNAADEKDKGDNAQGNFSNGNEQAKGNAADVNNDTSSDTAADATGGDDAPPTDAVATNPANDPAAAPSAAPGPGVTGQTQAAPQAPAAASAQAPLPGGRVRYAKQAGVQVVSSPKGGQVVRTLEQGDHPVTWEENGFLKIADGMYVPVDAMSDKGVPRFGAPGK